MNIQEHSLNCELVIGLVAPIGVNLEDVSNRLQSLFEQFKYTINSIHLSKLSQGYTSLINTSDLAEGDDEVTRLNNAMNIGNRLREETQRGDFYALLAIDAINQKRESDDRSVKPLPRHIHIIRSLKHTDEVETLRNTYSDGFFLLGISANLNSRTHYLRELKGIPEDQIPRLISRDDREDGVYSQRTRDVFEMADAFVTTDDAARLSTQLGRIVDILFSKPVVSPTADEYAMFMAYAASLRSADLSRQVGAVITNCGGDIIASGANDVPKFGGGLYWPTDSDDRDYIREYDSNEKEKNEIIIKIMRKINRVPNSSDEDLLTEGKTLLKETGLLGITEYGRAVHAEMEALMSAARNGTSVRDGTLYTTTYPCHNCAKHIIAAGIKRVRYIEPYPKSYASKLHGDSIETTGIESDSKVIFEPFVGVGPRRFVDLFSMNLSSGRKLIRKENGKLKDWRRREAELRVPMKPLSYLEAELLLITELQIALDAAKEKNNDKH